MNNDVRDELSHLKRYSSIRSGKNVKFLTPAVYSGGWCPMRVACNICEDIEGMSYLIVGMPECAIHSRRMTALPEGDHGELRRIYVLDANEVVFGCRKGLTDALREMDREGARAILMIATCVTDLIGEDFEGLISEIQPELSARLSFVTLGQFKNFGSPIGTWKTAEALASMMSRKSTDSSRANVLFIEPWRNKNEPVKYPLIARALESCGVKIRRIAAGARLDDYMNAADAALNLALCSYAQPLAAKMEAAFGIPYAPLHNAYAVGEIDGAYNMIFCAFGAGCGCGDMSALIGGWRDMAVRLEERARRELGGLRYAILPGVEMPGALAVYLAGFGMEPLIMHIEDFHQEDAGYAKRLKALGYDPPACRMMNIDRDIEIVLRLKPDICFGGMPDEVTGWPCAEDMGDFFGVTGYERTAVLLNRILTVLETGENEKERIDMYGPAPL